MKWLLLVGSLQSYVSFAKEPYKRDCILQKRRIILRSLLIVATPYLSAEASGALTLIYIWESLTPIHMGEFIYITLPYVYEGQCIYITLPYVYEGL